MCVFQQHGHSLSVGTQYVVDLLGNVLKGERLKPPHLCFMGLHHALGLHSQCVQALALNA